VVLLDHALRPERPDERRQSCQQRSRRQVQRGAQARCGPAPWRAAGEHGDRLSVLDHAPRRPAPALANADGAQAGAVDVLPPSGAVARSDGHPARVVDEGIGEDTSGAGVVRLRQGLHKRVFKDMDSSVLCTSCHWFGVYRTDVMERMTGCPSCGSMNLAVRGFDDDGEWRELGRRLLEVVADDPAQQLHQR
jgi:hypothetical protein